MAKKKRRRPQQRPRPRPEAGATATTGTGTATEAAADAERPASKRAERKEEARRERERRIRQARRRQRTRRLVRWGIVLGIGAGIFLIWYFVNREDRELQQAAEAAAERLNASEVEEQAVIEPAEHSQPYTLGEEGVPSFGGNHNGATWTGPAVLSQPMPEDQVIHNLEHGYVAIYYAADGPNALDDEIVSALEDLVEGESEVLMAPYPDLAKPLYLVAWGARQSIDPPENANPQDVVLVIEAFIEEWKNGPYAPEAGVP